MERCQSFIVGSGVLLGSADCGSWWLYMATYRSSVCSRSSRLLNRWALRTLAMRSFKRSTVPLVLGVLALALASLLTSLLRVLLFGFREMNLLIR